MTPRAVPWVVWGAGAAMVLALTTSAPASYLVRTVTAGAAAGVLLVAARRHADGVGPARRLFAASLLVGAASGVASAAYALVAGRPPGTGWPGDWLYLCYAPLAVAGVLALPRPPARPGQGWLRALADGAVAAGALWFLTEALVVSRGPGVPMAAPARVLTIVYPLVPAFVIAVMLSALPRAERRVRPFLGRAAAGVSLIGVSDVAFSVASWGDGYQPTSWIAALNLVGLLLLLDAALVGRLATPGRPGGPADAGSSADLDETRGALITLAPYLPVVVALGVTVQPVLSGTGLPHEQLPPLLLIGAAAVVRHLVISRETRQLVDRLARREQAAQTLARTDALTGLANRAAFVERLDAALRDPSCHPVAVALLDLNDFKDINDTHGHDTGDDVLRHTAERLRAAVPVGAVARLGGDEFAAFVPATSDGGHALGDTVAAAFAEPIRVGTRPFVVRPSVGVVVDERPSGGARPGDAAHLLAHADVAMYEAKAGKRFASAPVAVLTGAARASATATIRIRDEITAPDLTQFRVVYQPVVDLTTGEIRSAEALLRWWHPAYGEISPATFIPLAERVGSVTRLGDHLIDTVVADLAGWVEACGTGITVGVNVSPRQLTDPSFAEALAARLGRHGLATSRVGVEVTEEALVDDIDTVASTVTALRAVGADVAVDDFGTGYSSLRYLRRLDANVVKIDQEFVQAAPGEPRTDALVGSVVTMAAALGMACVAEGIETLEQLALVRAHGCPFGQGYLLDRPMTSGQLRDLLASGHVYPVDVTAPGSAAALPRARLLPLRTGSA